MTLYAIPVNEDTLDLLEILNNGGRPAVEKPEAYFVFDTEKHQKDEVASDIVSEDSLYNEDGHQKNSDMIFI
jgi:hypothetical protein